MPSPTTLPPELWSEIFALSDSKTLYDISLVCAAFQDLARKHLFRNLRWDRSHYAASPVWQDLSAKTYPQTLVLTDLPPKLRYNNNLHRDEYRRRVMALAGVLPHPHIDEDMHEFVHVDTLRLTQLNTYMRIGEVITSFTNLTSLEFRNATMPNHILTILHQFPLLESFAIISGVFDSTSVAVTPPPRLRELTLWRSRETDQFSWARTIPQLLINLLTPTLRTLRIDWNLSVAALLTNEDEDHPTPDLSHLTTLALRTPAGMSWVEGSPHFSLINPLRTFLRALSGLISFIVVGGLPDIPDLQISALPNLRSFSGPASVAIRLSKCLHSISMTDEWLGASVVANALSAMRLKGASPKSLEIHLGSWDVEVLYAIAELFRDVEELKIRYSYETSGPDDVSPSYSLPGGRI
jgi:hypothetical protein